MLCHQCALANPDDGRRYCERCHAFLAVTPGTGFKDLLQLSPEQFRTTVARGIPLIQENVMTLWNEAQEIEKLGNRRAVGILQLFAEEEAAKIMLLFDAVRCPGARRDEFRRLLRGCMDHLTKGIYVKYCGLLRRVYRAQLYPLHARKAALRELHEGGRQLPPLGCSVSR